MAKKGAGTSCRNFGQSGLNLSRKPRPSDHFLTLAADWPAVSAALQRADTAHIENNPADEQQALQIITRLQHDMAGLDDRLAAVGTAPSSTAR